MPIKLLNARQIFDTTGNPTVEVDLVTELGLFRIGVPSTDVKKNTEAIQLRDNDPKKYRGMGVLNAVKNINTIIAPELIKQSLEVTLQRDIDRFLVALDGTENLSRLGANAILAVSLVVAKAGAAKKGMPLYRHIADLASVSTILMPVPHFTILAGGLISSNPLPFQEYLILPTGATTFAHAMQIGTEVYQYVKKFIETKYGKDRTFVSDSGGFSLPLNSHRDALIVLQDAIKSCNYKDKIEIGLNVVASDLFKDGAYDLDVKNPTSNPQDYVSSDKLGQIYTDNFKEFNVCSIEDGFDWDDWAAWGTFTSRSPFMQVCGNDLTQTNARRVGMAVERKACNAITLRLNQCGTLTGLIDIFKIAKSGNMGILVEDRLGDTDDLFLADLVIGLAAGQIKCGAPAHERIGKYNHVLRIEEELGALSKYAGKSYRNFSAPPV